MTQINEDDHKLVMGGSGTVLCTCGDELGHVSHSDDAEMVHDQHIIDLHGDPRVSSLFKAACESALEEDDGGFYEAVKATADALEKHGWVYQG